MQHRGKVYFLRCSITQTFSRTAIDLVSAALPDVPVESKMELLMPWLRYRADEIPALDRVSQNTAVARAITPLEFFLSASQSPTDCVHWLQSDEFSRVLSPVLLSGAVCHGAEVFLSRRDYLWNASALWYRTLPIAR